MLHVLDTDQFAGTEAHVLSLMSATAAAGVDSIIACRPKTPLYEKALQTGRAVCTITGRGTWGLSRSLRGLLKSVPTDVVHAHNGRTMLAAALTAPPLGVKVIGTQHFIDPQFIHYRQPKRWLALRMHQWVNRRLKHVIAVSEAARRAMIEREGVSAKKISTVWSGIEIHSQTIPDPQVRIKLGVEAKDLWILSVARLEPEKGLVDLISAMPHVLKQVPSGNLTVVGDGTLRTVLEQQAKSLGISHRVRFVGFRDDVKALMADSDLLVLSSSVESFGLVLLEAMSLSKPVVAVASGGPAEIVVDGETGLLAPPADPAALARAIVDLLSNPERAAEMGRKGRERFERYFSAERMARETVAIYRRVLAA